MFPFVSQRSTLQVTFVFLSILVVLSMLAPQIDAVVHELTPELAEKLRKDKKKRYFVKMDAGPCNTNDPNDVCRALDITLWEPLSQNNPQEFWTRLDCFRYRDLCNELSTEFRVKAITGHRKVDFLTVAHSDVSPTSRLVEMYRSDDTSPSKFIKYLRDLIVRDRPFEAMNPSDIEAMVMEKGKNLSRDRVPLIILVLTIHGFTKPEAWEAFLKSSRGQARVFMHQKSSKNTPNPAEVIQVPSIFSHRGTIALVRPVIQLLRFALAYGGAAHYVVVSGDSVPLMSPDDMIRELSKHNQTRFERHAQDEFKSLPELRQSYKHFIKSKNWIVLNDQAARFFADPNNDHTHNFEILSMADEYYWINVAKEHNLPYSNLPVMYDEWPKVQAGRPNNLEVVNSTLLRANGHLFARKVTKDTVLQLDWLSELQEDLSSSMLDEL